MSPLPWQDSGEVLTRIRKYCPSLLYAALTVTLSTIYLKLFFTNELQNISPGIL